MQAPGNSSDNLCGRAVVCMIHDVSAVLAEEGKWLEVGRKTVKDPNSSCLSPLAFRLGAPC